MNDPLEPPEIVEVDSDIVDCDGGGALGHPRVWLNLDGKGAIDCPYCDRRFVLKKGTAATGGH
ncbi:MAG: zinc-finger domain-containing protein [Kiloniellaceae bacterium]